MRNELIILLLHNRDTDTKYIIIVGTIELHIARDNDIVCVVL